MNLNPSVLSSIELKKLIDERKNFFEKVVPFVIDIVLERGRVLDREQHSGHTYIKRELRDFGGFSFIVDHGHTFMGGNMVMVWYHGSNIPSVLDKKNCLLEVYFQPSNFSVNDCEVRKFDNNTAWQKEILKVIVSKDRIIAQIEASIRADEEQRKTLTKEAEQRASLVSEARRLGLK